MTDVAERFVKALTTKDRAGLLDVLDPALDFRALTPNRTWQAAGATEFVDAVLLGQWFEDSDTIETLESLETGEVGDRGRVAYLLRVRNADGEHLVEQQAYYNVADGRIAWLRVLCSGYRPVAG